MNDSEHLHGPVHASWDDGYAWDEHHALGDLGRLRKVDGGWRWAVAVPTDPDEIVDIMARYGRALTVLAQCRNPMEMLQKVYGTDDRRGLPGMPRIRAALDKCLEHYALRDHLKPSINSRNEDAT